MHFTEVPSSVHARQLGTLTLHASQKVDVESNVEKSPQVATQVLESELLYLFNEFVSQDVQEYIPEHVKQSVITSEHNWHLF